ncbi:MAG: hypothetical protein ACRENP_04795 [Longimicrobiales bacterium]
MAVERTTHERGRVKERRHPAWQQCLRERARLLEHVPELERRRAHLLKGVAERSGVRETVLSEAYDLALEEGLDPVLALELVGCGVGVLDLKAPEPVEEVTTAAAPAWVSPPLAAPDVLALERRMRLTFRRMRGCLEQNQDLEDAIANFCAAPDVDAFSYDQIA